MCVRDPLSIVGGKFKWAGDKVGTQANVVVVCFVLCPSLEEGLYFVWADWGNRSEASVVSKSVDFWPVTAAALREFPSIFEMLLDLTVGWPGCRLVGLLLPFWAFSLVSCVVVVRCLGSLWLL